jgi:hypothetical protein
MLEDMPKLEMAPSPVKIIGRKTSPLLSTEIPQPPTGTLITILSPIHRVLTVTALLADKR